MQVNTGSGAYALALAVIIAAIYLAVVRFMDLNEKGHLWAVGFLSFLGAIFVAMLSLPVRSIVLVLSMF